jgi:hypothetical protein
LLAARKSPALFFAALSFLALFVLLLLLVVLLTTALLALTSTALLATLLGLLVLLSLVWHGDYSYIEWTLKHHWVAQVPAGWGFF